MRRLHLLALLFSLVHSTLLADQRGAVEPKTAAAIYGQGVRETAWLTPNDEAAGFHLPDGFVAELVASEPQIAKPLNMAFDAKGQLWITDTTEYPYPAAAEAEAHDSIKVLSDQDRNGSFETVKTFASGLNIPIGILPVSDGVICFSIPNIMHLKDTDGDGKCDERKLLLGPFDTTRDTHGMINAIRQGPDGWIYACHGFNNQSHVKAADGSEIHLMSGNTFRFRPDGSHVEQFTNGQVNPFGMTSDEFGNWFTADCHSKPVTMLVQGGYYESFGRPHDGLGFVPAVMDHLHGSTAICGISYYDADNFPKTFRRKFYSGNVMTSRINLNRFDVDRNKIRLVEEPDFMTSDDPWFRPVDIQLGADGALYVADFYNKIIGHYEVRLDHPDRDRTSGRIWRIAYRGTDPTSKPLTTLAIPAASEAIVNQIAQIESTNIARRQFALEQWCASTKPTSEQEQVINSVFASTDSMAKTSDALLVGLLWAQLRRGQMNEQILLNALKQPTNVLKAVGALKVWAALPRQSSPASSALCSIARKALAADEPQLALAAANALATHGSAVDVQALLDQIQARPTAGAIVPHAMRIAVKRLMQNKEISDEVLRGTDLNSPAAPSVSLLTLAAILPAVGTPEAASALLTVASGDDPAVAKLRAPALQLACKQMRPEFTEPVVKLLKRLKSDDRPMSASLDEQTTLALEVFATLRAGGHDLPADLIQMLTARLNATTDAVLQRIHSTDATKPLSWSSSRAWQSEDRKRLDADANIKVISSLPLGEDYTGIRSSATFACPDQLTFWICGHDGPPKAAAAGKNFVRLVHAETGATLQQAAPPRNDRLHEIKWSLKESSGQPVRFECVDGDDGDAYAWLAVADFSLESLNPSRVDGGLAKLGKLLESMSQVGFAQVQDKLPTLLSAAALPDDARTKLIGSIAVARGRSLGKQLIDAAIPRGLITAVEPAIAIGAQPEYEQAAKKLGIALAAQLTLSQQSQVARAMIASAEGRRLLVQLVDEGHMAPQSLRTIKDLLVSTNADSDTKRLAEMSEAAAAAPSQAEQAIMSRIAVFQAKAGDFEKGRLLYEKNCQNCHKLRGVGQLIGPQLDGVGPRGHERLAEDILLPNRNVDKAFRMTSILMDDDRVLVGLVRETADGDLQLVGIDGKTQSVPRGEIAQRKDTTRSLMPDNFAEIINNDDLSHLLKFLTNK